MRARARIVLTVMSIVLLVVVPAGVAAATVPAGGAVGDVAAAPGQPAVEVPAEAVEEVEQPWTARFLVPILLVMGVAALVGSAFYYGVRIRGKYRVTQ